MLDYTADTDLASIRLIACDMDGTLLADDDSMPDGMAARIDALTERGIVFCAASGRPPLSLDRLFPESRRKMGFIADNGALMQYRGEQVAASFLDPSACHDFAAVTEADTPGFPLFCRPDGVYARASEARFDSMLRRFYNTVNYVESLDECLDEVDKCTACFPEGGSDRMFEDVYLPRFGEGFTATCSGAEWVDLMAAGVHKGSGLRAICDKLDIDVADAAAFGDRENDTQMLEAAGHSFVMANAPEHMRAHARFLAPSNNERGVAKVIDAILAARA